MKETKETKAVVPREETATPAVSLETLEKAVSYTHLTLPTTPYV